MADQSKVFQRDFLTGVSLGYYDGHFPVNVFGENPVVATTTFETM